MLSQIAHVYVNLGLISTHIIVDFAQEKLKSMYKVIVILPNVSLIGCKAVLHMLHKLLEEILVV